MNIKLKQRNQININILLTLKKSNNHRLSSEYFLEQFWIFFIKFVKN